MGGATASKYTVPETEEDFDGTHLLTQSSPTTRSKLKRWSATNQLPEEIFPDVYKDDRRKTQSNVLPEFAIPKFKQWSNHINTREESEHIFHVKATLQHCNTFTRTNRKRIVRDHVLTPRTLFSEIYQKRNRPHTITNHELYILETYVSNQQIKWDKEKSAAIYVQKIWRGRHSSKTTKAHHLLLHDMQLADSRKKFDNHVLIENQKSSQSSIEQLAYQNKILQQQQHQIELEKQHKESFMYKYIASGGLHSNSTNAASASSKRVVGMAGTTTGAHSMSNKKHTLLTKTLSRIANASDLQHCWNGVKVRDAWREWTLITKRYNFSQKAYLWHLQGWFDKWHGRVSLHRRMRQLLEDIQDKLYTNYMKLFFLKWWRNTRRRFRIFTSTDGITRILQENERFTPRSSVVISNWPNADRKYENGIGRTIIVDKNGENIARMLPNGRWI